MEERKLEDLPFTVKALEKARGYGHTPDMYDDVQPESKAGEFLATQVEEIEQERHEPAAQREKPVDAGKWRGHPNYGCPYCDFTSLDKGRVQDHIGLHSARTTPTGKE